ncbi:hypothetical protein Pmani_005396 [Petrolisthes manimaculis]|uniref:Telomerase reverse transcriptase n=1 Tax=Petrolisthes manimaculis TaxID=1843537 RepID=A0AAE1QF16_9EUCA|nr:hypothetical protein Pmani_005396 [Petrolisthes manimaculis]
MSNAPGPSAKRKREGGVKQPEGKRRCIRENDKKGYIEDIKIPFLTMLYRKSNPDKFHGSHILKKATEGGCGIEDVMRDILSMKTGVNLPSMTPAVLMTHTGLKDLVAAMVRNFRRVNMRTVERVVVAAGGGKHGRRHPECYTLNRKDVLLLLQCSPAASSSTILLQELPGGEGGGKIPEHTPLTHYQAWGAVMAVVRRVVPRATWGSTHNLQRVKEIARHITLLGRYDAFFLGHVMQGWRLTDCSWMSSFTSFQEKTFISAKLLRWVVERIMMYTIGSMFHVTEMSGGNYELHYYLHRRWSAIHDKGLNALVKRDVVKRLSKGQIPQAATSGKTVQKLRFLPKLKGVRPIIPSTRSLKSSFEMRKARLFMRELCRRSGSISAKSATVFCGMWQMFNEKLSAAGHNSPLYFVRADVKDAYGSVLHPKLFELLQKNSENFGTAMNFTPYGSLYKAMKGKKQRITYILLDQADQPMQQPLHKREPLSQLGRNVVVHVANTLALVKKSISPIVSGGAKTWFKMVQGLPQGASLSPSLCEFYYSIMCATHLKQYNTRHSILLRTLDDFLYVSASHDLAQSFLRKLSSGIPDFNCYINKSKTVTNINNISLHRVNFNGVTVCLASRQLLVDASGMVDIVPRYTLTLNGYRSPGKFVADRVQRIIRARLPKYVLCPIYTSTVGLLDNVWRVGFLSGARVAPMLHVVLATRGPINARFIAGVIIREGRRVWRTVSQMWKRNKRELTVSKDVVMVTFIGGVFVMLSWPGLPRWPAVHRRLKNFLKVLIQFIPVKTRRLLPRLPPQCLETLPPH